MTSESRQFIVETDAIYGGGVQLKRGDIATEEDLGQYVEGLLSAGAIRQIGTDPATSPRDAVSLR
jgi:hypothetical protein